MVGLNRENYETFWKILKTWWTFEDEKTMRDFGKSWGMGLWPVQRWGHRCIQQTLAWLSVWLEITACLFLHSTWRTSFKLGGMCQCRVFHWKRSFAQISRYSQLWPPALQGWTWASLDCLMRAPAQYYEWQSSLVITSHRIESNIGRDYFII